MKGELFSHERKVEQVHFGGGTPTYLSLEQIERVQQGLDQIGVQRDPDHEMINTNIDEDWWKRGGRGSVNEGKPTRKKAGAQP